MMNMKMKLVSILMLLLGILPVYSRHISFRMKGTFQHGCARMPSITRVGADYENGTMTVNIQKYSGLVWVYIKDVSENVIKLAAANINEKGMVEVDISNLDSGDYTIDVVLEDRTYTGKVVLLAQ